MSSSHQSKFPCIIITIIIILLFFSSFSTLLTVNLFVLFWRCFVMLNSYFVCFIIYIFFFNFEIFFVDIIFVPKIGVCFSFYPVSLIFEYEAKPHIRWPHIREYEAGESGANFTSVHRDNKYSWHLYTWKLPSCLFYSIVIYIWWIIYILRALAAYSSKQCWVHQVQHVNFTRYISFAHLKWTMLTLCLNEFHQQKIFPLSL